MNKKGAARTHMGKVVTAVAVVTPERTRRMFTVPSAFALEFCKVIRARARDGTGEFCLQVRGRGREVVPSVFRPSRAGAREG